MLKKILTIGLIVFLILFVTVVFFASQVVTNAINTIGPAALGVTVKVEKVRAFPLLGIVKIKGLVVGNPEGFKTDNLFSMGEFNVDLSSRSLLTDTIIIRNIEVLAPEITYEMTLKGSNIGALQDSLAGDKKAAEEKPEAEKAAKDEASGRKLIIENFIISDGKVKLSLPGMMGTEMPLPLPGIHLKDIGKEEQGASANEVIGEVISAVFAAVTDVVTSSGKLMGDGAKAVGSGVANAVGGVMNVLGGSNSEKKSE